MRRFLDRGPGPAIRPLPPIDVDGRAVPVMLRTSARAHRVRITVRAEGVEIVVPARGRLADAYAFLADSGAWIEGRVRAIRRAQADHPGEERLGDGGHILLRGRPVAVTVSDAASRAARVEEGQPVRVLLPRSVAPDERDRRVEQALVRWLRNEALGDARRHVARHGPPNGLIPRTLRVKEQARLWGSCSTQGGINLNWRLILAPPEVFEYVVVHELCHLEHPHHRPAFWRRVAELLPDYGRQRSWLKANGHLLTLTRGAAG